jgi:arylsulfatase A-like enzyme
MQTNKSILGAVRPYCGFIFCLALFCSAQILGITKTPAESGRHIVVVVWDGMRPDFVTKENTPTLWKLSREGVTFRNHHAVYPSATNVNGTALVTGVYPGRNGVIANHVYRPEIDQKQPIDVETPAAVQKGDELSAGKYISVPTIAELVQRAEGRTAIATAKTVGLLLDRQADPRSAKGCITLFAGESRPRDALKSIVSVLGPFPSDHLRQDSWTTKALTDVLWKDDVPAFSILWLGEPDLTQHETAPGAPAGLAAIKSSDQNLASVLSALERCHARETTDLFVVSDHGFSTIQQAVDLRKIIGDAGRNVKTEFTEEPKPGDILLAGNGGSVLFYVIGHDAAVTRRLVEFLQQSDFAGVIFTHEPLPGTFRLDLARIDNQHAPDIVMSFRWNDSKNQFAVPGMIDADWQRGAGKGTHATLSRFDMHNILIAAGPDFRSSYMDNLPSGNVDLAPTILRILGITAPQQLDGRILSEAMVDTTTPKPDVETKTVEVTKDFAGGTWRQNLKISRVSSTIYLDEGNGQFEKR